MVYEERDEQDQDWEDESDPWYQPNAPEDWDDDEDTPPIYEDPDLTYVVEEPDDD